MCHDLAGTDGTQYPPFVPKVFRSQRKSVCLSVRPSMNVCFSSISNSHKKRIFFYKICYFSLGLAKVIKSFAGIVITVGMGQSIVRAEGKLREAPNTLVFDWFSKEKTLSFESFVSYYLTIPTNQNYFFGFIIPSDSKKTFFSVILASR